MALNLTLKVHPVVLFQIVDAYERRNVDAYRVIGTLLGTVEKGVVEATNCFCVPHKEHEDIVEAELIYAKDLYEMNQQVNKQEVIVGWWATGHTVTSHSSVIHEYYSRECLNPIHMTLDTTLQGGHLGLQAFVKYTNILVEGPPESKVESVTCVTVGVPGGKQGLCFTPISVDVMCYEPEVVSLRLCQKTISLSQKRVVEPTDDLERIVEAATKLKGLIDGVLSYVEEVILGKREPDNEIGRTLLSMVHSVPKMSSEQFQNMFNTNVKDLLMVLSLAQLVHTQLQLNEKLTFLTTM